MCGLYPPRFPEESLIKQSLGLVLNASVNP